MRSPSRTSTQRKAIGDALAAKLHAMRPAKIVAPALGGVIIGYTVAEGARCAVDLHGAQGRAMTLRRGFRVVEGEPVVIVEDVVTTGNRLARPPP